MRRVLYLAPALLVAYGICAIATAGPLASGARAAGPQVTVACTTPASCTASGTGFTPSGRVLAQGYIGGSAFSSSYLTASAQTLLCATGGVKPVCHEVGGGTFTAALPVDYAIACDATADGTVRYTDGSSGLAASQPVSWVGPCTSPTTTTLSIPSTVDTGWTAGVNPARVMAGSTVVTSGTVTITVNGVVLCSYTAGSASGCTSATLPAGTDQVEASYSGSAVPPYDSSSTTETVTVLAVKPSGSAPSGIWAGYVATGDKFTSASASWTVPTANCGSFPNWDSASSSATWVGIDGSGNTPVEQIGTYSNCIPVGTGEYQAWWEMYPGGPTFITIPGTDTYPVYPGDFMSASVTLNTSNPSVSGVYTLAIEDHTQGWSFSTNQFNSLASGLSAECIEEQPSLPWGLSSFNLTNFGSVTFSQCKATGGNGIATPIWDYPNSALTMSDATTTKATVSPLSDDGTQFTVTFVHP
jgi:Peptidase A4 family